MDFIKKAQQSFGGSSSSSHANTAPADPNAPAGTAGQPAGQKDDYVDKAFGFASKKFGMNTSKEQNEKITDAGRGFYEKQTGSKVSDKVCISPS